VGYPGVFEEKEEMIVDRKSFEKIPAVEIMPTKPEDSRGVAEVFHKTWLATYPNEQAGISAEDIEDRFKDAFTEEALTKRSERIAHPAEGTSFFVAKDGEKVVGVCNMARHPDRNQLQAIYVLPEYQGKGVGTLLWEEARKHFDAGKDIVVQVAEYNKKAIDFYERLGFVATGKHFTDEHFKMKSGAMIPETELIIHKKEK
jgi:ribosomal protein S18 acetylase RimI-like enzyme